MDHFDALDLETPKYRSFFFIKMRSAGQKSLVCHIRPDDPAF